jgi:hypothetical protein
MDHVMTEKIITIGTDYTTAPGGRYRIHGEFSGEDFRENVLVPALQQFNRVTVFLDGTAGYAGSFLEEAFGGLIREAGFTLTQLNDKLTVCAKGARYEVYRRMALQYIQDAAKAPKARVA